MTKTRLLFVDNLRTLMIVLVILVHLSVTYGGEGSWFYKERPADMLTITVLSFLNAVTQAYFMGLLFLLAAYFTPGAYDRKGPRQFLRDRLLRLGVPLLVYEFVIHPLQAYPLIKAGALDGYDSFGELLAAYYTSFHIGSGPLWFVETLLVFAVLYAILRLASKQSPKTHHDRGRLPGPGAILVFAAALGVLTFLVRLRFPVNWALGFFNLQLPFFVQYIAMLIIGVIAYRRDWLIRLPKQAGRLWLVLAGALIFVIFEVEIVFMFPVATVYRTWVMDGRGLFATVRLRGLSPLDEIRSTVDPRRMVRDVADLVRRLHACGLVHKDLYLNHLYAEPGGGSLTLVDLGRLTRTTSRRLRVKDLAALYLSARPLCTRTALLRGLRRYGGDRRLARRIVRKAQRMARHVPRRVREGTHSIAAPCTSG